MHADLLEGLGNQKQMNTSYQQMLLGFCNWGKCTHANLKTSTAKLDFYMVECNSLAFKETYFSGQFELKISAN